MNDFLPTLSDFVASPSGIVLFAILVGFAGWKIPTIREMMREVANGIWRRFTHRKC
jgi:hypothetical protein